MADGHDQDRDRGNESERRESGLPERQQVVPRDSVAIDSVDPRTGKPWQLFIRMKTVEKTGKKEMRGLALELGRTVPEAVQKFTAVFRGMTDYDGEDGDEDWLIYVAIPSTAYDYQTGGTRRRKGEVFLVFVDDDREIRRWRWTDADPNDQRLPVDHDTGRFRERLL
jgi:hypothetical protein